jgi:hypothetical protein
MSKVIAAGEISQPETGRGLIDLWKLKRKAHILLSKKYNYAGRIK